MIKRSVLAIVVFALGAGAVVFWQCAIYEPSLLVGAEGGQPDSGVMEAGDQDVDMCAHTHWPARPAADSVGGSDHQFYMALSYLDFGVRDAGMPPTIGFDLDGVCTCPGLDTCKLASSELGIQHCDFPGGVDNAGETLISRFAAYPGFFDQGFINLRIAQGYYGALVRVRQYNGLADDTQVEVSMFTSNGTEGVQSGFPTPPKGDGTDKWTLDPSSLLGATVPDGGQPIPAVAVDVNAYVSGGQLVGNLDVPLTVGAGTGEGTITVDLTGSVIVGTLTPVGSSFRIDDGVMAGRWEARKLLVALGATYDPLAPSLSLCGSDPVYQGLKKVICQFPDITSNVQDDNKNAPCDALSFSFSFKSRPATFGSVFAKPDAGLGTCGTQWSDECPP